MIKWINFIFILLLTGLCVYSQKLNADLLSLTSFGNNPGDLKAFHYQPEKPTDTLVVLLHGCGQDAKEFARYTGFLEAAEQKGFSLLIPQQLKANNIQLCFNWFSPADYSLNQGESASIMAMIEFVKSRQHITKTYLAGFSAGGALVSSLLALHPDSFNSGAIVAGIIFPCADSLAKAISCMKIGTQEPLPQLASQVNQKHENNPDWPNLQIIAGENDSIVSPANSRQLATLWGHMLSAEDTHAESSQGVVKTLKRNTKTNKYIELIVIKDFAHGWPINPEVEFGEIGAPFALKSPFSAVNHLLKSWKIE